jgi:hypothetical protein
MDGTQPCAQDPDAWFPEKGESTRVAKQWCRQCPFIRECLAYALTNEAGRYGVWGGTSERERRNIRLRHGLVVISRAGNPIRDTAGDQRADPDDELAATGPTEQEPHAGEEAS